MNKWVFMAITTASVAVVAPTIVEASPTYIVKSEDWLKIVKTRNARNKINSYFQKKENEEKAPVIKLGESLLKEELKKEGLDPEDYTKKEKLDKILHDFQVANYNELFYSIGCKSLSPSTVVQNLTKIGKKEFR